jgi:hypothetical protein
MQHAADIDVLIQPISEATILPRQWMENIGFARFSTLVFMSFHRNIKGFTYHFLVFGDKVW